jgi:hypothetical protein
LKNRLETVKIRGEFATGFFEGPVKRLALFQNFVMPPQVSTTLNCLKVLSAQFRERLRRETVKTEAAERQTCRFLYVGAYANVNETAKAYFVGNKRIEALNGVIAAIEKLRTGVDSWLRAGKMTSEIRTALSTVIVASNMMGIDYYRDFKEKILSKVFSEKTITSLSEPTLVDKSIRNGLSGEQFTDEEFDLVLKTIGENCGVPEENVKKYLKKPNVSKKKDPRLSHCDMSQNFDDNRHTFVEKPGLYIPSDEAVKPFTQENWAYLRQQIDYATG